MYLLVTLFLDTPLNLPINVLNFRSDVGFIFAMLTANMTNCESTSVCTVYSEFLRKYFTKLPDHFINRSVWGIPFTQARCNEITCTETEYGITSFRQYFYLDVFYGTVSKALRPPTVSKLSNTCCRCFTEFQALPVKVFFIATNFLSFGFLLLI